MSFALSPDARAYLVRCGLVEADIRMVELLQGAAVEVRRPAPSLEVVARRLLRRALSRSSLAKLGGRGRVVP